VRAGQVRAGQVRAGQVRAAQVRAAQVRAGQVRAGSSRLDFDAGVVSLTGSVFFKSHLQNGQRVATE